MPFITDETIPVYNPDSGTFETGLPALQDSSSGCTLPEYMACQDLTDGTYRFVFKKGLLAGEFCTEDIRINQVYEINPNVYAKVVQITTFEDTAQVDILIVSGLIPVIAVVGWLVVAGIVATLIHWTCTSVTKLSNSLGTDEVVHNSDGTITIAHKGFIDSLTDNLKTLLTVAVVAVGAFFLLKNKKA